MISRQVGFPLRFQSIKLQDLLQKKEQIIQALKLHGCICLKGLDFTPGQLVDFTLGMFGRTFTLAPQMAFNNQDPLHKQVTRVGNIKVDGSIKDSKYDAAYWHQDGDFLRKNQNSLISFLHTKVQPETGGQTWFIDLVKAHHFIKQKFPQIFKKLNQSLGVIDFYQIKDFKAIKDPSIVNTDRIVYHQIVRLTSFKDKQCLYVSSLNYVDKEDKNKKSDISPQEVTRLLEKEIGYYSHKWQSGDLLIWDNVQVMHRASGDFSGKRLLYRTHALLI